MNRKRKGRVTGGRGRLRMRWLASVLVFVQLAGLLSLLGAVPARAATVSAWDRYQVASQVTGWSEPAPVPLSFKLNPLGGNGWFQRTGYLHYSFSPAAGLQYSDYVENYLTYSPMYHPTLNTPQERRFEISEYQSQYPEEQGGRYAITSNAFVSYATTTQSRGAYVDRVYGSPGQYPNDGVQGGYYYVAAGTNTSPTLSVDQTAKTVNRKPGNTLLTLGGTVSDPDGNQVTISATVSGVTRSVTVSPGAWQLVWSIDDIAAGTYTNIPVNYSDGVTGSFASPYTGTATVNKTALVYYDKYTVRSQIVYTSQQDGRHILYGDYYWYQGVAFDPASGKYIVSGNYAGQPSSGNYRYAVPTESQTILLEYVESDKITGTDLLRFKSVSGNQDVQGTLVESNILELDGTFPSNGKHTDGFWYVRKTTTNLFPTITLNSVDRLLGKSASYLDIQGSVDDPDKDIVDVSATVSGVAKTVVVDTNSNKAFNLRWALTELADGEYPSVTVTVSDRKGGTASAVYTSRVLIDRVAPADPVISLSTPSDWTSDDVTVTVTPGYDQHSSYTSYRLATTNYATYTGPITYSTEGSRTFTATTYDEVGNETSSTKTFGIVKTPPTKPAITVTKLGWTSEDVGFSVTGSTSIAPLTYEFSINGEEFREGNTGTVTAAGVTTIVARAKDAAGGLSEESTATVQLDRNNPEISVVPNGSDWGAAAVPVKVTASDTESGVNAVQYAITESKDAPESWVVLPDDGSVDVANEGVWYLHVKALDKAGNTSLFVSSPYQIQNPPVPVDPGFLTATALSSSEVQLSWGGPASALKDGFEYTIQNELTGKTYTAAYPTLTVTDTTAVAGTVNTYKMVIKNHTGTQETSASALTYPDAPTKVISQVESLSGTDMNIAWDAVTGADSYRVVVRASNGGGVVQDLSVSDLQTVVSGLTPGTSYTVYVSGVNATGEGTSATLAFLTLPAEPGGFMSVLIQEGAVDLAWSPVPSATDYRLYRDDTEVATVTEVTYGDRDLEAGTAYQYAISSVNETGEGDKSDPLSLITLPAKDSSLALTSITADSLTAEWAGVKGAEGYTVELLKDASVVNTQTVGNNSYTFTSLEPGSEYTVRLSPYNTSGAGSSTQLSTTTVPAQMNTDITSEIGQTGVTFTYGPVQGATQYKFTVDGVDTISTTSPAVLSGLKGSTEYDVEVRAGNEQGFGAPVTVHILTKPSAPSNLVVTGDSETGLTVTWDKDVTATSYKVSIPGLITEVTTDHTIQLTGLEPGVAYTVEVIATNPTGEGTVASVVSMTLPAAPILGDVVPAFNNADVTWGIVTGAASYEISSEDAMYYSGTESDAKLSNLEDGHLYKLNVVAINALGGRSKPLLVTFTTKVAEVAGISVDEITENSVYISIPVTGKVVDHFSIKRNGEVIATVPNDGEGYSDSKLDANTAYEYEITPVNASGEGTSVTRSVKTPTLAVNEGSVKVEIGTDKVTISFDKVEGGKDYVLYEEGKEIWRGGASPIELVDLLPGSSHDYVLRVDNGSETLSKPIQVSVLLLPGKPDGISVTTTDSSATFTFPTDSDPGLSYAIVLNGKEVGRVDAGVTTYKVAPLKSSTDYTFEVFTINKTGRSESPAVLTVKTKDAPTVPVFVSNSDSEIAGSTGQPVEDTSKGGGKEGQGSGGDASNVPVTWNFTDISSSFAREEINYLAAAGVVKGVSAANFEPARTVTRMEFAAMLVRAKKEPLSVAVSLPYQDIRRSAWYIEELKAAVAAGVADGFSPTRFGPDLEINREQATKMTVNAVYGKDFVRDSVALLLVDKDKIAPWAQDSVSKAVIEGLMKGFPDGAFRPKAKMTRAEAAALIFRMLDRTPTK